MTWCGCVCESTMQKMMIFSIFPLLLLLLVPSAIATTESSEPRIIGTNHEPEKILLELTDPNSLHPGRMLALSLFGALAVISSSLIGIYPGSVSRRRSQASAPFSSQSNYVENIHKFEKEAFENIRNGISNTLRGARILGKRTSVGLGNVIHGVARVGRQFGSGLDRLGRALALGTEVGLRRAILGVQGITSRAGGGLQHFVTTYNRGLRRAANNLGRSAGNGLRLLGFITSAGVSRMGTVASSGLSRIGGFAFSSAGSLFNAALNIPLGLAVAAKERAVQDCLIQTVCYISAPIFSSSRQKRMIISQEYRRSANGSSERDFRENGDGDFRMEDCEVFECRLASLGRKALGVFSKMRQQPAGDNTP